MMTIERSLLQQVCAILGDDIPEALREARVLAIAESPMHARRMIDFTREAFGIVLLGHFGKNLVFPQTFKAKAADGGWVEFSFDVEPVFRAAVLEATEVAHSGPRNLYANIATSGALYVVVAKALNDGVDVEGGVLSAPAMLGVPAEIYQQ